MKTIQRLFMPGSKWVYMKIYTGEQTADRILVHDISYIINCLFRRKLIDKWFFIRYGDPDFHLRIRVLVKDESLVGDVLSVFYIRLRNLLHDRLVWKVQLDTYNREMERYGSYLLETTESLFCIDSENVLSVLKSLTDKPESFRWMIGLKMIDSLLSNFQYNLSSKLRLMLLLSEGFKGEFGFDLYNSKQLNAKYREYRSLVGNIIKEYIEDESFLYLYHILLDKRHRYRLIINELLTKYKVDRCGLSMDSLLASYIHMMMNRLFKSKNRLYELVMYEFLYRYYKGEQAKEKYVKHE